MTPGMTTAARAAPAGLKLVAGRGKDETTEGPFFGGLKKMKLYSYFLTSFRSSSCLICQCGQANHTKVHTFYISMRPSGYCVFGRRPQGRCTLRKRDGNSVVSRPPPFLRSSISISMWLFPLKSSAFARRSWYKNRLCTLGRVPFLSLL